MFQPKLHKRVRYRDGIIDETARLYKNKRMLTLIQNPSDMLKSNDAGNCFRPRFICMQVPVMAFNK